MNSDLLSISPQELVRTLRTQDIRRFFFVYDAVKQQLIASHPIFDAVARYIQADRRDFMQHEGLFFQVSQNHDVLHCAFVHKTCRGQGAGGVRYWHYSTFEDCLRDGLRLAKGMTRKNALAGLWWGGGKGIMVHDPGLDKNDSNTRSVLYREYGGFMSSLRGCYVTAEDVGTQEADMANIHSQTRFTTCIHPDAGGSGNPSMATARGVVCGIEAALTFLDQGTLQTKSVAVQGLGNVGLRTVRVLFEHGVQRVVACDVDQGRVDQAKNEFGRRSFEAALTHTDRADFLATDCEILVPCATGGILNSQTIPDIRATLVCGAANNQLEDSDRDDRLLYERGIIYIPDFLTNRMGIVHCANEQYGYVNDDPLVERHLSTDWEHSIHQTVFHVLEQSRKTHQPPGSVALALADELALKPHPINGHRGVRIIQSLVENQWHSS